MITHEDVIKANREYYKSLAAEYFTHPLIKLYYSESMLKKAESIINTAIVERNENFLDFGCGHGTMSRLGMNRFKRVVGIDISMDMLAYYANPGKAVLGDGCNLPFPSDCFDMIAAYGVIHHILDWRRVYTELYRVLHPGGVIYIDADPNATFHKLFKWLIQLRRFFLRLGGDNGSQSSHEELAEYHQSHEAGFALDDIVAELQRIGYQNINVEFHTLENFTHKTLSSLLALILGKSKAYPLFRLTAGK